MTTQQQLNERKQRILAAVIEEYLNTAIPVGSRALSRSQQMHLSPASIRNEMSDLEADGYLQQLHTSAGRTPTVRGYRFYVDHLMKKSKLRSREEQYIADNMRSIGKDIEELLHGTLKIISTLTDYAAIAVAPVVYHSAIKVVQMVLLNVQQSMVVLMTNTGLSKDIVLDFPHGTDFTQEDLNLVSNLLTQKLQGMTLDTMNQSLVKKIVRELPAYKELILETLDTIHLHLEQSAQTHLFTAGLTNMLKQPEFRESDHVQLLLQVLEQEKELAKLLQEYAEEDEVHIRIGTENAIEELKDFSIMVTSYGMEDSPSGNVAIVGPTRMLYDRSAAVLNRVAAALTQSVRHE